MGTCESRQYQQLQYGRVNVKRPFDGSHETLTAKFECERPLLMLVETNLVGREIQTLVDTEAYVKLTYQCNTAGRTELNCSSGLKPYDGEART